MVYINTIREQNLVFNALCVVSKNIDFVNKRTGTPDAEATVF